MIIDDLIVKHGGCGIRDSYTLKQVRHLVKGIKDLKLANTTPAPSVPTVKKLKPSYIKKGDIFMGASINHKNRPFVVAVVKNDMAYCIPLSTTDDEYSLIPHNSRFLEPGFYGNSFLLVKADQIMDNFRGVLDDNRTLNKAIKLIIKKL